MKTLIDITMDYRDPENKFHAKEKICKNHPVSKWREGYKRCYWGFKLKDKPCEELIDE
jgi:hypothetical protein